MIGHTSQARGPTAGLRLAASPARNYSNHHTLRNHYLSLFPPSFDFPSLPALFIALVCAHCSLLCAATALSGPIPDEKEPEPEVIAKSSHLVTASVDAELRPSRNTWRYPERLHRLCQELPSHGFGHLAKLLGRPTTDRFVTTSKQRQHHSHISPLPGTICLARHPVFAFPHKRTQWIAPWPCRAARSRDP